MNKISQRQTPDTIINNYFSHSKINKNKNLNKHHLQYANDVCLSSLALFFSVKNKKKSIKNLKKEEKKLYFKISLIALKNRNYLKRSNYCCSLHKCSRHCRKNIKLTSSVFQTSTNLGVISLAKSNCLLVDYRWRFIGNYSEVYI